MWRDVSLLHGPKPFDDLMTSTDGGTTLEELVVVVSPPELHRHSLQHSHSQTQ